MDYRVMRISVEGKPWLRGYGVFWVVFDAAGEAVRWGKEPCGPVGPTHADFVESVKAYHQAIHKPVLDQSNGRVVEDPVIRRAQAPKPQTPS